MWSWKVLWTFAKRLGAFGHAWVKPKFPALLCVNSSISIGNYTVREELMKNTARIWWKWLNTTSAQHEWYSVSIMKYKRYFSLILRELRCNFLLITHLHKMRVSDDKKMQKQSQTRSSSNACRDSWVQLINCTCAIN